MDLYNTISTLITVILGGGWFVYYKANKKKANAEASIIEADGWKAQQEVYQTTIEDMKVSCDYIRNDRDLLRKENEELRKENVELRKRIGELEDKILEVQKEVARNGRRIEALVNKEKRKKNEKEEKQ